jgi:hypothetical protein
MKMNSDIQKIQLACKSLSDESKRLSTRFNDYEFLIRKIHEEAEASNSKLSASILAMLNKFEEL